MKRVLVHWVEMRTYEVPDDCPTDDTDEFDEWIGQNTGGDTDTFVAKRDSRDYEIVYVEEL